MKIPLSLAATLCLTVSLFLAQDGATQSYRLQRMQEDNGSANLPSDRQPNNSGNLPVLQEQQAALGAAPPLSGSATQNLYQGASSTAAPRADAEFMLNGAPRAPLQMQIQKSAAALRLSASEIADLGQHDIVLLVDKSTSMGVPDCPSLEHPGYAVSRWEWCREQTTNLAAQTSGALPDGLAVVIFSTFAKPYSNVEISQIPMIFSINRPGGMTNESNALHMVLADYFNRRKASHGKVRPMLIAVVTDGLPTNASGLKQELLDATKEMKRPDEIKVTFLQIGGDPQGIGFTAALEQTLMQEKAKFDIVTGQTFPQLLQTGLAKALVYSLSPR